MFKPEDIDKIIQAGARMEEFLSDPVIDGAFSSLVASYHQQWENTTPNETQKREEIYTKLRVLKEFLREFRALVDEANAAKRIANSQKLIGGDK